MKPYTSRRAPWTCEWGRFCAAIEDLGASESRIDDVFWACHNPVGGPDVRIVKRHECETCPLWTEAVHLRPLPPS
jgi:hypothetical protein